MEKALKQRRESIIKEVTKSGLRGRGGAAFPTGIKWKFTARSKEFPKYVVCNADEGEPGTFKDKLLFGKNPYSILEAMTICGYAVGAENGFIYLRGEYFDAFRILEKALRQVKERKFLGENILNSGISFNIQIYRGAGAYVCGEETALLDSFEGKKGQSRVKPPFPTFEGLRNKPTVLNNVETFANIPHIILNGSLWYSKIGEPDSPGTKLYCLSGDINKPGVYEATMDITLKELLNKYGGGVVGKSSLLNLLTQQEVSIVSPVPGTTTDPVFKPMELLPIGPVLFIDTGGLDDCEEIGNLRVNKSYQMMDRTDVAVLVTEANVWTDYEETIISEFAKRKIPFLVAFNKIDLFPANIRAKKDLLRKQIPVIEISAVSSGWEGTALVKRKLIEMLPDDWLYPAPLIADLISPSAPVVLVSAKDLEMPKGRIKLPMQQVLRGVLDRKCFCLTADESNLTLALDELKTPPQIVVSESHILNKLINSISRNIPVTTFSILFARWKGDLDEFIKGVEKIHSLNEGDNVLILEVCTHHPIGDDIGRSKIPRWIKERQGDGINFDICSGHDIPENLEKYKLVIHCGACMLNRKEMLTRILRCKEKGVAITNYGIAIAYLHNVLGRTLQIFQLPVKLRRQSRRLHSD